MSLDLETIGVAFDTSGLEKGTRAFRENEKAADKTADASDKLSGKVDILTRLYRDIAAAAAAWKLVEHIKEMATLNARYETMGVVMRVAGNNAGYTGSQMLELEKQLQKTGISMLKSRETLTSLATANIDLAKASGLARASQDLAVVANINSSEAFARMVQGIKSGESEVLRTMGLNVSFEVSYKKLAAQLHTTSDKLTENQKVQARTNAVVQESIRYTGIYEEAMGTAGKQLLSMQRYTEDLKVKQGEVFNEILTVGVIAFTAHLKDANGEVSELARNGQLKAWGESITEVFVGVLDNINNALAAVKLLSTVAGHLSAQSDIRAQYDPQIEALSNKGFDTDMAAVKKLNDAKAAALKQEDDNYEKAKADIVATEDRFGKALMERRKATNAALLGDENQTTAETIRLARSVEVSRMAGGAASRVAQEAEEKRLKAQDEAAKAGKKEAEAYTSLISAIRVKTAENRLELMAGENATESQKIAIKMDQELASGKLKLSSAHISVARAALLEQAASEELLKMRAAEKDVFNAIIQSTIARNESKEALVSEYALYGKSAEAREVAIIAIKAEAAQEKFIADQRKAGKPVTAEMIAQLSAERDMRVRVEQSTLAQGKALAYVKQLADENKRFSAESIADEYSRAKALLQIDADLWRERIALAGEGTEAQRLLQTQFDQWYANRQMAPVLDRWKNIIGNLDNDFREGFRDMLSHGQDAWKSFAKALGNTLKTSLADALYQTFIKKYVVQIVASLAGAISGPAVAGALTGQSAAGNAFGMASNGLSLYNAGSKVAGWLGMGGGTSAAAASSIEAAELGSLMSNSIGVEAALTAEVSTLSGTVGSLVSAIPGWGWALAGAALLAKSLDHSGTYHTGSASSSSAAGTQAIDPRSLGFMQTVISPDSQKMTDGIASSIANILNSTATNFGKSAGYSAATAFADDTSKDGAWGALLINKMGDKLVDWDSNRQSRWAPREFADGQAGQQQYIAALSASVRTALDGIGLPVWAQKMLDGLGSAPTIEALSSVVDNINATQKALVVMGESLAGFAALSDGAVSALIAASGGIQSLAGNASAYYDNFYSEGEKVARTTKQITEALAAVGVAMPATRDEYRAQVEAEMALGEAHAPAVAALLKVAGAFATITESAITANDASATLKTALSTAFSGLQKSIDAERVKVTKAYDDSLSTITKRVDKLRSLSDALNSSLGSRSAPGQFGADYAQAQAQIITAAVIARAGGGLPDASSLQSALATVAQPTEQLFATFTDYQRDFLKTSNSIKDLAGLTDVQLSVEERSLKALEDGYRAQMAYYDGMLSAAQLQIDAINGLRTDILPLYDALVNFNRASVAAGGSVIGVPSVAGSGSSAPAGISPSINNIYQQVLGRSADMEGAAYWQNVVASGGSSNFIGDFINAAVQNGGAEALSALEYAKLNHIPGFAVGTSYVPHDMPAWIHEGEEITPRPYVDMQRSDREKTNALLEQLVSENQSMRKTVELQQAALEKIEKGSTQSATILTRVTRDGNALLTEPA
jgi:hypothetical protein